MAPLPRPPSPAQRLLNLFRRIRTALAPGAARDCRQAYAILENLRSIDAAHGPEFASRFHGERLGLMQALLDQSARLERRKQERKIKERYRY